MMRSGQVVKGFRIDAAISGGGKSETARATRLNDGAEVFLKRFMSPKYPEKEPDPDRRARSKRECTLFEERHRLIMASLGGFTNGSGHLVKPIDFFRDGTTYYKVYPLVTSVDRMMLPKEGARSQEVFVKTLALSLRELHVRDIVHCDLKPDNVLVQRAAAGLTAKLIDYDEAFVVGDPPRDLSGDPNWFSPERHRIEENEADRNEVTLASDVFTFALLVHYLVDGKMPEVSGGHSGSMAERVLAGGLVKLADLPCVTPGFNSMARQAMSPEASERPTIDDMCLALGLPPAAGSSVRWKGPQ